MAVCPVILCGGNGTRLWPLSRTDRPKQFIPLCTPKSPLQETIQRLAPLSQKQCILVSNENHRSIVQEEARYCTGTYSIILEPEAKNTAPAITLAALSVKKENPTLLIIPSDHHLIATEQFYNAIAQGELLAQEGKLICFGISPTSAETGYGYIQQGKQIGAEAYNIASFVEKPSIQKAQEYVDSGSYYWNAGIFMFTAQTWLDAMKEFAPDILEVCTHTYETATHSGNSITVSKDVFSTCRADSIDYAVMEHTQNSALIPLKDAWNDLGSFASLYELGEKDEHNNVCIGNVVAINTQNSYIHTTKKLVTTIGLDTMIVVETPDALLVARMDSAQDIKTLVEHLKEHNYPEVHKHHIVHRPWGNYQTISLENRFQVKCITVYPGECLSLQLHHHRAEHWVVVEGTGKIWNGDTEILLREDQSTYIPLGTVHRLENPGKIPLKLIEVQTGSYLGEDDIVRLEDTYGRV